MEEVTTGAPSARGARPPVVEGESRVKWLIGLFQTTLPSLLHDFSPQNQLVIHLDADLYSSTLYVLTALSGTLRPGVIAVFDEFSSVDNEFRALEDFSSAFRKPYRVLGRAGRYYHYSQVAIQFQG